jgi:hypothetical protein
MTRIIFLAGFVLSMLIASGCAPKKAIADKQDNVKVSQPRVFTKTLKNVLYKADLKIGDRELSGLMFFNQTDSTMRVVMLSEVGLKYFDIEYRKNDGHIDVHDLSELLDYKKFKEAFFNFLTLVMMDAHGAKEDYKIETQPGELKRVIDKGGHDNHYTYNSNSGAVNRIVQSGFLTKNTTIEMSDYDHLSPGKILFLAGNVQFDLAKVDRK